MNGKQKDSLGITRMQPANSGALENGVRREPGFIDQKQLQPCFVRLPKPGTLCPFTGLSRTQMYLLCKSGKVKSYSLKRRGARRGVRLIDFQSLVAAIEEFASTVEQDNQ
jgi:hypothetical protein